MGLFSERLEAMIAAALQDGVLTDKERELLKKRAEKEGEDWDEVEMIIEARLAEMKPVAPVTQAPREQAQASDVDTEDTEDEEQVSSKVWLQRIRHMIPQIDPEHLPVKAKIDAYDYLVDLFNEYPDIKITMSVFVECAKIFEAEYIDVAQKKVRKLFDVSEPINHAEEIRKFRKQKLDELGYAHDHRNDSPEAKNIWRKVLSELTAIDAAIRNGAKTVEELKMCTSEKVASEKTAAEKADYGSSQTPNSNNPKQLIIPEGVEKIENRRYDCSKYEEILFPSSLETIGESAFEDCKSLKSIDLSNCSQLETIGFLAFGGCLKLESVIFPSSLKEIDSNAFGGCEKLKDVDFSQCDKLEEIESEVFYRCEELEVMDFSHCKSLHHFAISALSKCNNIRIVDFSGCINLNLDYVLDIPRENLEKLILPSGQKAFNAMCIWNQFGYNISNCKNFEYIPENAFEYEEMDMKEMVIPDTVETIQANAFYGCKGLKAIVMPASLKEIGEKAFYMCEKLSTIDLSKCSKLERIGSNAFAGMNNVKEIIIPDTVKTIGKDAFNYSLELVTIVMPASLKEIASIGEELPQLKKIDFSKVTQLKVIPQYFSKGCDKLKELTIPQGVIEIEHDAFSKLSLKTLFLPPSLTEIGDLGCREMTIYCYSSHLEELEPLVYDWYSNGKKINLYVLSQYIDAYTAQRDAEGIPNEVLPILSIPDEYLYYYDN